MRLAKLTNSLQSQKYPKEEGVMLSGPLGFTAFLFFGTAIEMKFTNQYLDIRMIKC